MLCKIKQNLLFEMLTFSQNFTKIVKFKFQKISNKIPPEQKSPKLSLSCCLLNCLQSNNILCEINKPVLIKLNYNGWR